MPVSPLATSMPAIHLHALAALRAALSPSAGAYLPGENGYSIKRWAINAEKPAALVVCPATPQDVAQVIAFAQGRAPFEDQERLEVAVKSGGYSPAGASSSNGGIVIDLQCNMKDVRIDPAAKLAHVDAGCVWGQVDEAAIDFGLATVSAILNHIGVGGLTLEAGLGWLSGQHGLTIDNVVQMTVVTASGDILKASESENSDLFWALRGGGGNFGIVTEFVYRLHEQQSQVYSSVLAFPPPKVEPVIHELNSWLAERTEAESAIMIYTRGNTDQPVMVLHLVYNGSPDEGAKRFDRFKKLNPVRETSGAIPFVKLNTLQNEHTKGGKFGLTHGSAIPVAPAGLPVEFVTSTLTSWLNFLREHPMVEKMVALTQLYHPGKMTSIASGATAYPNREKAYTINFMMQWADPAFTWEAQDAIQQLGDTFDQARDKYFFPKSQMSSSSWRHLDDNAFSSAEIEARYGSNYSRLVDIKSEYDPSGLFGEWFTSR